MTDLEVGQAIVMLNQLCESKKQKEAKEKEVQNEVAS